MKAPKLSDLKIDKAGTKKMHQQMAKVEKPEITINVFQDLGFSDAESANLETRAQLMIQLEKAIKNLKTTQAKAAKLLEVKPSRVSEIMKGRIEKFSVDLLIVYLARLGKEVQFKVLNKAA